MNDIHWAAKTGDIGTVRGFLAKGINVNKHEDTDEGTPLHYAVWGNQVAVARLLLEHGANVSARDDFGFIPFQDAVMYGRLEIVKLLIEYKADVNKPTPFGDQPIHLAVMDSPEISEDTNVEIVRLLLDNGADVNAKNGHDQTPLQITKSEKVAHELRIRGGK